MITDPSTTTSPAIIKNKRPPAMGPRQAWRHIPYRPGRLGSERRAAHRYRETAAWSRRASPCDDEGSGVLRAAKRTLLATDRRTFLGFLGFGTVLPGLAPHVRLTPGRIGPQSSASSSTFSVVALCSRAFAGRLADRKGRKGLPHRSLELYFGGPGVSVALGDFRTLPGAHSARDRRSVPLHRRGSLDRGGGRGAPQRTGAGIFEQRTGAALRPDRAHWPAARPVHQRGALSSAGRDHRHRAFERPPEDYRRPHTRASRAGCKWAPGSGGASR